MQRTRVRGISVLAIAAVVLAGYVGVGGDAVALSSTAATGLAAGPDPAAGAGGSAMGGSGVGGVDAQRARAVTNAQQAALTGDIVFSVPSGTFQGQVSVALSTAIAGAQIRYSTDGKVPSGSSSVYSAALTFTATTQLRAQAFVGGAATGAMGTAVYVARSVAATHDLPLVVIDDYGAGKPTKTAAKDAALLVMAPGSGSTATSLGQAATVATRASFHVRGQSSSNFAKTPYKVELRDNLDKGADYPLLGMPADSDWALLGPFPDKTLIRDAFAWDVGRAMGLGAPRYAFVELYLNLDKSPLAADDYQGVYLLAETIKRSSDRVDIAKLTKSDTAEPAVSGGYILQFNLMATDGDPTLTCTVRNGAPCWSDLVVMYPKGEDLQAAQKTWITGYVQKFHDALHGSNPSNAQSGYPAYIDVDSFVNRIIHNELAREADAYIRSTHFFKDRGGKLVAGPVWDYDLGYESVSGMGGFGGGGSDTAGWQYQGFGGGMGMSASDWFTKLMADPTFLAAVKTRWRTLRAGVLSNAQLTARVNTLAAPLANAAKRNFTKWNNLNTAQVGGFSTQTTQTWDQQLQIMRDFLTQRANWLDSSSGWGTGSTNPPGTSNPPGSSPPAGTKGCTASLAKAESWSDRFNSTVTVKAGNAAITNWTVTIRLNGSQSLQNSWNATVTSGGGTLTAKSSGNGNLAAGASTTFGFTVMANGNTNLPTVTGCTAS